MTLPLENSPPADRFNLHPALLDAALHTAALGVSAEEETMRLPFSWNWVCLRAAGASTLRVLLHSLPDGGLSLLAADEQGQLVVSVGSLTMREVASEQLGHARGTAQESLYSLRWSEVEAQLGGGGSLLGGCVVLGGDGALAEELGGVGVEASEFGDLVSLGEAADDGLAVPRVVLVDCAGWGGGGLESGVGVVGGGVVDGLEGVGVIGLTHGVVGWVLGLLQKWLGDERFVSSRLVFLTRGGVGGLEGVDGGLADVGGLVQAPVWGLVRSAQSEHPGRFVLLDVDGDGAWAGVLANALALDEPQLAVRDGAVYVPGLSKASDGVLMPAPGVSTWRLEAEEKGTLRALRWLTALRHRLRSNPGRSGSPCARGASTSGTC